MFKENPSEAGKVNVQCVSLATLEHTGVTMLPAEIAGMTDPTIMFPGQPHGKSDTTNEQFTATKRRATNSGHQTSTKLGVNGKHQSVGTLDTVLMTLRWQRADSEANQRVASQGDR